MNQYWDGTKWVYQYNSFPMYTYTYPDNNAQVIAQLLKRIAELEAKIDGHKK